MLWRLLEEAGGSPNFCHFSFGEMLMVKRFTLADCLMPCLDNFGVMSSRRQLFGTSVLIFLRLPMHLWRRWHLYLVLPNGFLEISSVRMAHHPRLWITFLHWCDFVSSKTEFYRIIFFFLYFGFRSTVNEYIEAPEWLHQCCMILPSVLAWFLRGCWA